MLNFHQTNARFFWMDLDELRKPLDDAVNQLRKTRIIRLQKREGLIRTRMAGAREAKGDILIFFDSHIEVNTNWLPPLIEPIAVDYKTSVCPFIDIIKWENFAYIAQDEGKIEKYRIDNFVIFSDNDY